MEESVTTHLVLLYVFLPDNVLDFFIKVLIFALIEDTFLGICR